MREERASALSELASAQLPSESEEVWRYSRIDELDLSGLAPSPGKREDLPEEIAGPVRSGSWAGVAQSNEGLVVSTGVSDGARSQGVSVASLSSLSEHPGISATHDTDSLATLARAFSPDGVVVEVPEGVRLNEPIVVVHFGAGGDLAWFPQILVHVGAGASAQVVELLASSEAASLCIPRTRLVLDEDAHLDYLGVQRLGGQCWQVGYQSHQLAARAHLSSFYVALGGDYARMRTDSVLGGPEASSELLAAYFAQGNQVLDFRTRQDHAAPRTRSELFFKGAVAGEARSVYTGLIRVRRGAIGSDAFQTNRNLVLSEGSHANSVPNLEIEENDVRCSHASAVGPVDAEQLYYLESRGVPPAQAERLIVLGFFEEVLARLPVRALSGELSGEIGRRVSDVEHLSGAGAGL